MQQNRKGIVKVIKKPLFWCENAWCELPCTGQPGSEKEEHAFLTIELKQATNKPLVLIFGDLLG